MNSSVDTIAYPCVAAVTSFQDCRKPTPRGACWIELHTFEKRLAVLTWLPMPSEVEGRVPVGEAALELSYVDGTELFTMLDFIPYPTLLALDFAVLSDGWDATDVVGQTQWLIETIDNALLRHFVKSAFSVHEAFLWFWTCPASIAHHHAEPGGLARHSLDVATRAARAMDDDALQRDFAIAYALLHDYGKLWSYEDGHLTSIAQRLSHELIGYEKLLPLILRLRDEWLEGGLVMQSLLSGEWKRNGTPPIQAVGNVVRSLDQFSAEGAMVDHKNSRIRSWRPRRMAS